MGPVSEEIDGARRAHRDELEALHEEALDVNRRLERLYDSLETGRIELADLAPGTKELRGRQETLMARRVELEVLLSDRRVELAGPDVVRSYVAGLHIFLAGGELVERRAFIRSFVKEVRVTGDEVVLTYTMPLMPDGSSVDKVGVLPVVQHGGRYWT